MRVLHPLFVHLHIAFLLMAFVAMYTWLFRGLASSVFEDRIYRFARVNTWLGVITVALSMIAGIRDGLFGIIVRFSSPHGGWLVLKTALATLLLGIYGLFLYQSSKKKSYLQEDRRVMLWCLVTQGVGILVVAATTTIGTMLVYYRDLLPLLPNPFGAS
ncbi:MAG: DUF2231 domain-containing protein [Gemmatimonadota bacterium]